VGKKYGSKRYPQRNAALMGRISLWISFAASIFFAHKKRTTPRCSIVVHVHGYPLLLPYFFCPQKTHNATLFYRGIYIQGRSHLVTAAMSVQSCLYRSLCVTIKIDSAAI
jgi:hypothetical protein